MTETKKLRIYRIVAIGLVGYGACSVLDDLRPFTGFADYIFRGVGLWPGLYLFGLLGAANLVNSFLGRRFALFRWGAAVINAGICLYWVFLFVSKGWIRSTFAILILAAFLALLILSTLLARVWGKAATEAKEAG